VIVPLGDGFSSYISYSHSSRQPSYTELNYESPGSLGNRGLEPEESIEGEGGIKWTDGALLSCKVSVFTRRTENTVDWIKASSDSPRWEATNIGDVETMGTEMEVVYTPVPLAQLHFLYTYLDKNSETNFYASRYVMDFPEHYLKFIAKCRITQQLELAFSQTLRIQRDNQLRNSDNVGAVGDIYLKLVPPKEKGIEFTLSVDNLWNDDFEFFAGQRAPGRRISLSLTSYF
jgi:outer membrane cobalamin receptor